MRTIISGQYAYLYKYILLLLKITSLTDIIIIIIIIIIISFVQGIHTYYLKQTMFLGYTVLQLFRACYSWCI
jgi:hypothetical protein